MTGNIIEYIDGPFVQSVIFVCTNNDEVICLPGSPILQEEEEKSFRIPMSKIAALRDTSASNRDRALKFLNDFLEKSWNTLTHASDPKVDILEKRLTEMERRLDQMRPQSGPIPVEMSDQSPMFMNHLCRYWSPMSRSSFH